MHQYLLAFYRSTDSCSLYCSLHVDIITFTYTASFTLHSGNILILWNPPPSRAPANPQYEMLIVPPPRQQTDRSATDSSNSRELKSDEQLQHGSTHDPRPSCAGTAQVQTLAGRAGDMDGLSGNVPLHCTSQVQLTAHANAFCERLIGSARRECLDFMIPLDADHLRRILKLWTVHYNRSRPHSSLGPGVPDPTVQKVDVQIKRHCIPKDCRIVVTPILAGLHHEYKLERIAA